MTREIPVEIKFIKNLSVTTQIKLKDELKVIYAQKEMKNGIITVLEMKTGVVTKETVNKMNTHYEKNPPKRKKYYYKITTNSENISIFEYGISNPDKTRKAIPTSGGKLTVEKLKSLVISFFQNEFLKKKKTELKEEAFTEKKLSNRSKAIIDFINGISATTIKDFLSIVSTGVKNILLKYSSKEELPKFIGFLNYTLGKMFEVVVYNYLKNRLEKSSINNISKNLLYVADKNDGQTDIIFVDGNENDVKSVIGFEKETEILKNVSLKRESDTSLVESLVKKIFTHLSPLYTTNNKIDSITRFIKYVIFIEDTNKAKSILVDVSKKIGDIRTKELITDIRLLKMEIDKNIIPLETIKDVFINLNKTTRAFLYENVSYLTSNLKK
jgi:hypothetical protein